MTTIAYKNGVMAADTMMNNGGTKTYGVSKLVRLDGWLVGFAGALGDIPVLKGWLQEMRKFRAVPNWVSGGNFPSDVDCEILIACRGGLFEVDEKGRVVRIPRGVSAIGSGAPYALGAMEFGATAVEAVEVGCALDLYSGGEGRCLYLDLEVPE